MQLRIALLTFGLTNTKIPRLILEINTSPKCFLLGKRYEKCGEGLCHFIDNLDDVCSSATS